MINHITIIRILVFISLLVFYFLDYKLALTLSQIGITYLALTDLMACVAFEVMSKEQINNTIDDVISNNGGLSKIKRFRLSFYIGLLLVIAIFVLSLMNEINYMIYTSAIQMVLYVVFYINLSKRLKNETK